MSKQGCIVGIDLGTTHTVVAYSLLAEDGTPGPVELFRVPQLIGAGEVSARDLLPSFLYAPLDDEQVADPWGDAPWALGEYARNRGREVVGRQIASAKSWLCHPRVDRSAAILPWASEAEGLTKLSPVQASARLLSHVRVAWDRAHPELPLDEQQVVLTVPASFDQGARELTLSAASAAGLNVRLLEEPQAAFYAYLADRGQQELEVLSQAGAARILVCDVGGGTTDLTLIEVSKQPDGLNLERVAVGNHLLLGGDNIDLTLAHLMEKRLAEQLKGEALDPGRFAQLVMACRAAKEQLLGPEAPNEAPIRLLGRGSALLGNTLKATLSREEVQGVLFDGFLPEAPLSVRPKRGRGGLVAFGLPYEADPAITHHVAWFLTRHSKDGDVRLPSALLFNGGLFRAKSARARLQQVFEGWAAQPVSVLSESDPDRAVARGAVVYGLALRGEGPRIGGGSARGYYIGAASEDPSKRRAICVIPKGAKEGEAHRAAAHPLSLLLGQAVRFDLYASDDASVHAPGSLVDIDEARFIRLPPVSNAFEADADKAREIRVELQGELSAIGTLELACEEQVETNPRRYALAFDLRGPVEAEGPKESLPPGSIPPQSRRSQLPGDPRFEQATDAIDRVFGKGRTDVKARETKDLVRDLEKLLGERKSWTPETNRALFDKLIKDAGARKRSADHERIFWLLAGFCLRPGFGYPGDEQRINRVAKLIPAGLIFHAESRNWQSLWVAWRRLCGGLPEEAQIAIRDLVDPFLAPAEEKLKKPKKLRPTNPVEMLELASSLERLPPERRADLGRWILERTWTDRDPRLWEALSRIGARNPMYASAHHVVPTRTIERWLDHMTREKWEEVPAAARAAVSLGRVTGDRSRDIGESAREAIIQRLEKAARAGMPVEPEQLAEWTRA
ncbi:MAG: Hsp70 family protein, partial [Myxococcales bacterium]|nr:Hsp70 family protein [Myxococcales bacterium]